MKKPLKDCGFLTVAYGEAKYIRMAENLVISYINTSKGMPAEFTVIASEHPRIKLPGFIKWQVVDSPLFNMGLEFKLYLHKLANKQKNIFIDCDSLVYSDITSLFERFDEDCILSPLVHSERSGEWCGASVEYVCSRMGLTSLLKFNGGFYYFKNCQQLERLLSTARDMKNYYSSLGFTMLGGSYNEEPLISLALSNSTYQHYMSDDGSIMSDLIGKIDFTSFSSLTSPPLIFNTTKSWLNPSYSPSIVHYGSAGSKNFIYIRDALVNKLIYYKTPPILCRVLIIVLNYAYLLKKQIRPHNKS